ncbi:neuromedin-u receptor 2 [Plakobranchus ocellatus]|uniref:Neuromedin-u receptor 2 n=1 Tax=Plakobranchus ocellatus TaxID=259542 RepID=A0AAV4D9G9_9GAST|nr:neuromedin-u receptor 2 [Plakobranchus ocellatus]
MTKSILSSNSSGQAALTGATTLLSIALNKRTVSPTLNGSSLLLSTLAGSNNTIFLDTYDLQHTILSNMTSAFDLNLETLLVEILGAKRKDLSSVVALTVVYLTILFTGVVGNVCTCIVIARNAYMRTATNCYLFSLAVSDVLTLLFGKYIFIIFI